MRRILMGLIASGVLGASTGAGAQNVGNRSQQFMGDLHASASVALGRQPPERLVISGLKAVLADGTSAAVTRLGRTDGFWGKEARRIPLPAWMHETGDVLRRAGLGPRLNSLQLSMNRAAEQATTEAGPVVRETINAMRVTGACDILQGSGTAATQYLRDHAGEALAARFGPIVAEATARFQTASHYESLIQRARPMRAFVPGFDLDLDDYVTRQSLAGLFALIGQQEKAIRDNPSGHGAALLAQVFPGAVG